MARAYPAINKCAFIYMYDAATMTQVQVGQFEDWSLNDQLNTLEYRECGYNTPLLVPLDFSFTGILRKGKLNHNLIKQLWGNVGGKVDIGSFGYWNIPKSQLVLIKQFSDGATEEKTTYTGCIFFSHTENNYRGLIQESVNLAAETMTSETQALVPDRSPESP